MLGAALALRFPLLLTSGETAWQSVEDLWEGGDILWITTPGSLEVVSRVSFMLSSFARVPVLDHMISVAFCSPHDNGECVESISRGHVTVFAIISLYLRLPERPSKALRDLTFYQYSS